MRHLILSLGAFLLIQTASAQSPDDILGEWVSSDNTRIIEFIKKGAQYEAIILKADLKEHIGQKQITSLSSSGKGTYSGGTLNIIRKDKEVDCTAILLGENELEITGKMGWMSKSFIWTRVDSLKQ